MKLINKINTSIRYNINFIEIIEIIILKRHTWNDQVHTVIRSYSSKNPRFLSTLSLPYHVDLSWRRQHQRGRRCSVCPRGNDRSTTWLGQGCVKKSTASTKIYPPFHGGETFLALCQSRMLVIERGDSSRKKGNRLIKDKGNVIPPAHQ